jgi:hypothetical protein
MIRKLKVGEVIRDGDFFTANNLTDGGKQFVAPHFIGQCAAYMSPIFREIPDRCKIIYKDGSETNWRADKFIEHWTNRPY